jgi:hypothetical protein
MVPMTCLGHCIGRDAAENSPSTIFRPCSRTHSVTVSIPCIGSSNEVTHGIVAHPCCRWCGASFSSAVHAFETLHRKARSMARTTSSKGHKHDLSAETDGQPIESLRPREDRSPTPEMDSQIHLIAPGVICDTDRRGSETPQGRSPLDLVVDASAGFIPLWEKDTVLRWRFRNRSMDYFQNPAAAKTYIRNLFAEALLAWGSAAPVTFKYDEDLWDFEIVMRPADQCNGVGCVLAAAFFPDGGRHELEVYPKMFTQIRKEQVDTLIHEIGHVFGLRHFFANISENQWPSEIFGRHEKFSIMNYGEFSELTDADKEDLTLLYQSAWNGELTHINGTPIRLVKPFSATAPVPIGMVAEQDVPLAVRPQRSSVRMAGYHSKAPVQSRSDAAYLNGR